VERLLARVEEHHAQLAREDEDVFDRQRQNLRVLVQFATRNSDPLPFRARDQAMAANVGWIQQRERGTKMVLWAHNGHIAFRPGAIAGVDGMGRLLRQTMGTNYLSIGFAFREGSFRAVNYEDVRAGPKSFTVAPAAEGTLDAALSATGHPILALDLRSVPGNGPVREWFDEPQGTWGIEAGFTLSQPNASLQKERITRAYDALLFVNHTTAAVPVNQY
jgi:erythromycin esterase